MVRLNLLHKVCSKCKIEKVLKQFNYWNLGKFQRHPVCKTCFKLYQKPRRKRNTQLARIWNKHNKDKVWSSGIMTRYGISITEYNRLLEQQNGVCAICEKPERLKRKLSVDHSHTSKRVRGLLCIHCNLILGLAKEKPEILSNAIEYLEKNSILDIDWDVDNLKRKLEACGI